ncbi:MAG TPA: YdeI/OmpD-associated family protein [Actinomycetes bacterium]|nr:YdeI/OmpD-associated family protein [Actinomycetes bacterium]
MRFTTTLLSNGKTATGIEVPAEVMIGLGGSKKPAVTVTVNGHAYRSTVATVTGRPMVGVTAEVRTGAEVAAGDRVEVDIELDTAPREVDVPQDLAAALAADPAAARRFDSLSYSNKRRHTLPVEGAKTPETQARRVAKAVATLHDEAG